MSDPTISTERRRRLLIERQTLGWDGRSGRTVDDVAARLALLHSTDPSVPYLSLHARSDTSVGDIDRAFYDDRTLLRVTTLRRTVFAMPLDVAALAVGAYNTALAARLRTQLLGWLARDAVAGDERSDAVAFLDRVEQQVVDHLRLSGPTGGASLASAVPGLRTTVDPMPGAAYSKPIRITSKVLEILAAEVRIARGRPPGDLTSGAWTWEVVDDRIAGGVERIGPTDALAGLLERYLAAFGPATVTDATWWTGLTKTAVRGALERIGARRVEIEDGAEAAFVLGDDELEVRRPDDPGVALLPGLDPTTMGWKQRSWYVDDSARTGLFDANGNAGPTIWVDGRVVGVWTQRADGEVVTELLDDSAREHSSAIESDAQRLATWLGDVRVRWRYPTPLSRHLGA